MKLTPILILFFLTVLLPKGHAQKIVNFYRSINIADSLYFSNNLEKACFQYANTIKEVDFVYSRVLKKILKVSKEAKHRTLSKECRFRIRAQKKFLPENKALMAEIDNLLKLDQKVRSNKFWKASQYYRKHLEDARVNQTKKFIKSKKLYKNWLAIDSSNITKVLELIAIHGYLGEQELGSIYANKFQVLLIHFDTDTNSKILSPILKKALHENKITPFTYTSIIDRHLYNTNKTQKFWTWMIVDEDPNLSEDQIKKVLALRESIGMFGTEYKIFQYKGIWNLNNLSKTTY